MAIRAVLYGFPFGSPNGDATADEFESVEQAEEFVLNAHFMEDFPHHTFFLLPREGEPRRVVICTGCEERLAVPEGTLCARCAARQIGA
jgi:hypothetical protein